MHGQWLGAGDGDLKGRMVLDLDDMQDHVRGSGFFFPEDRKLPATWAPIVTPDKSKIQALKGLNLLPLDWNGNVLDANAYLAQFPGIEHAQAADITINFGPTNAEVSLETSLGTTVKGNLMRSQADRPSKLPVLDGIDTWDKFKKYAGTDLDADRYIFRGQDCCSRLRTSFHRTNRSDLVQFVRVDAPLLLQAITPTVQHYFNFSDPAQVGAFYNLVQHHGYPTPLLDWSLSPFIAAFFAYRRPAIGKFVRIFVFDTELWKRDFRQFDRIANLPFHFSLLETVGIANARLLPQQAVSTLTNVDDIESYVLTQEERTSKAYLRAIDLPAGDRPMVMKELRKMGITAASLFPGLDGACEGLRGRLFDL